MPTSEPPGSVALVDVAGLRLRVEAESERDLLLVRRILGDAPVRGDVDATITFGPIAPAMPARRPDFEGPYGDHWDDGTTHWFHHLWGLAAIVHDDRAVLGGPAAGHDRWVTVRNSMLFVLARLFYHRDRFMVHGAALRRGDHAAALVVGESGSGKSTLTFAGSRCGWSVLGDDMVVVDGGGGRPRVQGVPRVPSVPGDVAHTTGVRGDRLPDDDRARIELAELSLDRGDAPVGGVLVCGHGAEAAALRPLTGPEALQSLVPAFVLSALAEPVRRWFPHAVALSHGPCAELLHTPRADDRLDDACRLLGGFDKEHLARHDPKHPAATSSR